MSPIYLLQPHVRRHFPYFAFLFSLLLGGCGKEEVLDTLSSQLSGDPEVAGAALLAPPYNYQLGKLMVPGLPLNDPLLSSHYLPSYSTAPDVPGDLWGFHVTNASLNFPHLRSPLGDSQREVVVAIIDSGIDYDHPDLAGRVWVNQGERGNGKESNGVDDDGNGYIDDFMGWNWVHNNNHVVDDNGHGTHVAGTLGATGGNGLGLVGVAPWVRLMVLKACDFHGECYTSDIRAAIDYAVRMGADVINISLGGPSKFGEKLAFDYALDQARRRGVVAVASAGNESADVSQYVPANSPHLLTVTASRNDGGACTSFANTGWRLDFAAPGCSRGFSGQDVNGILSAASGRCGATGFSPCCKQPVGGLYCKAAGTSMATPHLSGLVAQIKTWRRSLDLSAVKQVLSLASQPTSFDQRRALGRGVAKAGRWDGYTDFVVGMRWPELEVGQIISPVNSVALEMKLWSHRAGGLPTYNAQLQLWAAPLHNRDQWNRSEAVLVSDTMSVPLQDQESTVRRFTPQWNQLQGYTGPVALIAEVTMPDGVFRESVVVELSGTL